ncbi:MAG TPA: response regulator transcription factor [Actinomycetota bacterium]|nr:response regulator transcription factor [Actinomycetota bacterium]
MDRIVMLTDRSPNEVLPAGALVLEVKAEPLSVASLDDALALEPQLFVVDAAENAGQAYAVLRALRSRLARPPAIAVVERNELDRFRWEEVVDEVLYPGAPEAEIRLRLAIVRRRHGAAGDSRITLGPLTLDVDTYRVSVQGRALDLTFKEFELLRFLAERPGRVFTRPALMREVWGYDFYGGTRTVDVHVRRLRAKLGPAYEGLIETVRGVGYRTADI